ncbi:MAG: extracellular solute-binding protein, partial [Gammaproteobacteria bacterium]
MNACVTAIRINRALMRQLAILPLFCALAACGAAAPGPTVIDFWAMGREGEAVKELLPEFERRHPGLRVRVQQVPWSAAHEKLLTAFAGDALPDVFHLGNTWLPELVALHALAPLDAWLPGSIEATGQAYFAGLFATQVFDGHAYGLPWYVDARLLFYRHDLLAQAGFSAPPRTWAEWLTAMERIQARAGPGGDRRNAHAIFLPMDEWEPPVILALGLGASLLKDQDRYGNFRDARFRRALAFYTGIFDRGLAPALGQSQIANLYQDLARGRFAMFITGPWNIG